MNHSPQPLSLPRAGAMYGKAGVMVTAVDEDDVPLGCECAYPVLQIERWRQEAAAAVLEN